MKIARTLLIIFSLSFSLFYGAGLLTVVFPNSSFGFLQIVCAALMVVVSVMHFFRRGLPRKLVGVVLLVSMLMVLSCIPSLQPDLHQDMSKWYTFFAILLLMAMSGLFLGQMQDPEVFAKIFAYSLFFITVAVAISARESVLLGRLHSDTGNPIWIARAAGIPVLYVLYRSIFFKTSALEIIFGVIAFGIIVLTGSRGPAFSLIFVAMIWMLIRVGPRSFARLALKIVGCIFVLSIIMVIVPQDLVLRFLAAFGDSGVGSGSIREDLWHRAYTLISRNPMGWGMGGFQLQTGLPTSLGYPHNLVLESLVEPGLLFSLLFVFFVLAGMVYGYRVSKRLVASRTILMFYFGLMTFAFLNSMVSGDMTSPKLLYLFSVMFIFGVRKTKSLSYLERPD